jgi:polyhydroxyalkanoate synthesis repressor PhaR
MLVKKYGNRRLYDTEGSRYITLDDLATRIRAGGDVEVIDAKTGQDLTQATLAQIILESRGAARLLPVPLLKQLIRMGDDALSEFFGRYMTWALDIYLEVRRGTQQTLSPWSPFTGSIFGQASALSRLLLGGLPWAEPPVAPPPPTAAPKASGGSEPPLEPHPQDDIAELRRDIEELKRMAFRRSKK